MIRYGCGDGDGYGSDYGGGCGYGDGYGSGYGSENCYGFENGYGYGDRDGNSRSYDLGDGNDNFERIEPIEDRPSCILTPWPYIRVGCKIHTVSYWRKHWREIARKNYSGVSSDYAEEVLSKAEKALR